MSDSHVEALEARHTALDKSIAAEMKRPHPDDLALHELKKQKLRIKEEIAQANDPAPISQAT